MRIIGESSFESLLEFKGKGMFPQNGTKETEIFKVNFLGLGQIAKIESIEGNSFSDESNSLLESFCSKFYSYYNEKSFPYSCYKYSLDISIWKVVALIFLLPIFGIQRIFGAMTNPIARKVTIDNVKISAVKNIAGKLEMQTEKYQPPQLRSTA